MTRRSDRINALSVWALLLVGLGGIFTFCSVNSCSSECYGIAFLLLPAAGLTLIGAVIGVVSWSFAVRDAVGHSDRASAMLLALGLALSIAATVYLGGAALVRAGSLFTTTNVLISLFPSGWNILLYATPAVFALLYLQNRDNRNPRLSALGGLSAVLLFVPLILAPPWSAFNPADRPSVLETTVPASPADCVHGIYPPITVRNAGGGMLRWTGAVDILPATFSPHGVAIRPAKGAIGPGGSQTVMLVGAFLPTSDTQQGVSLAFDSNGGPGDENINCQTPSSALRVTPSNITTTCRDIALPLITVANVGQGDALWSLSTAELGFTITPESGLLHSGQSQGVAVYGNFGSVVGNAGPSVFTILFNGGPQPLTVTIIVTCT